MLATIRATSTTPQDATRSVRTTPMVDRAKAVDCRGASGFSVVHRKQCRGGGLCDFDALARVFRAVAPYDSAATETTVK